jgi:dihydrofolate reductase
VIRIIAAVDLNLGIAKHGIQPWYIPIDEAYFNEQTVLHGGTVLMGKTTFDVIGHPLADRKNIVLSRTGQIEGIDTAKNLQILNTLSDVWVIGGASVFAQTIDLADELYLTQIEANFGCDQFFPNFNNKFKLLKQSEPMFENGFTFHYNIYQRQTPRQSS